MHESPINPLHRKRGAAMTNEHGWNMPLHFSNLAEEHEACRSGCGAFDLSHLGKFHLGGRGAAEWLESVLSNSGKACHDGSGQTTFLLRSNGSIIDRLLMFRENDRSIFLLGHAARASTSYEWLRYHCPTPSLRLQDMTHRRSGIALVGPQAVEVLHRLLPTVELPPPMEMRRIRLPEDELFITHAGITGTDGYELFMTASAGIRYYDGCIHCGAVPCGCATLECLRLEAGIADAERDLRQNRTPVQVGLDCYCDRQKDYPGAERLRIQRCSKPLLSLAALDCAAQLRVPAAGDAVTDVAGHTIGSITSATALPEGHTHLAFAYLLSRLCRPGTALYVLMQGRAIPACVRNLTIR